MNDAPVKPWYSPRSPSEITAYPWLHPSAVDYLESILRPEFRVLEHGAGGSTLWFAQRVESVVTVEHSLEWRVKVRDRAPSNVVMLERFTEMPAQFQVGSFDLFMIDGKREKRGYCLLQAHKIVKPGGWVVLDNSNRPEYADDRLAFSEHAQLMRHFDNNEKFSKYFVTEFWQCHASE